MNGIKQEPEEEEKEKEETSISPQKDTNVTKNNDDDNQNTHQRDDPNTKRKYIPFEERVQQLKKFKEQYGHCSVSVTYDMSLYQWCRNIKLLHRKLQETQMQGNDRLSPKRIKELEDLGFDFTMKRGKYANNFPLSSSVNKSTILKSDDENDDSDFEEDEANDDDSSDEDSSNNNDSEDMIQIQSFNDRIKALKNFKKKYGHLDVPWKCDRSLYSWCRNMRSGYKRMQRGEPSNCGLSHERVQVLKGLGFDFRAFIDRKESSVEVSTPSSMHGTAQKKRGMDTMKVPLRKDITSSDVKSQGGKRDKDDGDNNNYDDDDQGKINKKDMIQIQSFNDRIKALKKFKKKYGHLDVPRKYDQSLYSWCRNMRSGYKRMKKGEPSNCGLSHERVQVLKGLGFDFRHLTDRKESSVEVSTPSSMHGTAQKKRGIDTMKVQLRKDITSIDVKSQGGNRDDDGDNNNYDDDDQGKSNKKDMIQIQSFNDRIKALNKFKAKHGHLDVPWKYDQSLYTWSSLMRSGYKHMQKGEPSKYGLTHERVQVLKGLGFDFRHLTDRKESSVEVSTPSSMHATAQKKRGMDTMKVPLRKDITSIDVKSQGGKRTLSNSTYSIETRTNKRTKSEPVAKSNATMRSVRPVSPAFDLARYTYEELLQQAQENKAMCQRMETNAKVRHEKSLEEIDSCIFNSDDEDSSKRKFECRFCGLKFDFQCVCILHMPKCKERKFGDPILIKRCES